MRVEVRSRWRSNKAFGFDEWVETIAGAYTAAGYRLEEMQHASRHGGDAGTVSRPLPIAVTPTTPMPAASLTPMPMEGFVCAKEAPNGCNRGEAQGGPVKRIPLVFVVSRLAVHRWWFAVMSGAMDTDVEPLPSL